MSEATPVLALQNAPDAVRRARRWVGSRLDEIGRPDLRESAQLGVSELVTNAIIHAGDELVVQVAGTREHPRIEVRDPSPEPPRPGVLAPDDDRLLATYGRGLALVAAHSAAWGSHVDAGRGGKLVWFEPAPEPHETELDADLFDFESVFDVEEPPADMVDVHLLGMPVGAFRVLREQYQELRRELRLLALAHPDSYPLAVEFSEVTMQVERERRLASGPEVLTEAIERGLDSVDLHYLVPPAGVHTMARLDELLDLVAELVEREALLVAPVPPDLDAVRRWYLGEFVRQGRGEEPLPWRGSAEQTAS